MTPKGKTVNKTVNSVPPARQRDIDWDSMATLAKMTGKPVLAATHLRNSRVKSVRQYTRPPFVTDEGRIVVELRNSRREADGERWGDVYLRWEPTTTDTPTTKEG